MKIFKEHDKEKYYFDEKAANRVIKFIETCCVHLTGSKQGKPLILEVWQKDLIREFFGWKVKATGFRKYRTLYLEIPRKNGKTTFGACLALYLLFADSEGAAEIYGAAFTEDQANICYRIARGMVEKSPILNKLSKLSNKKLISLNQDALSFYRPIASNPGGSHGLNPHGIFYDELHTATTRELYDVLTTAQGAREQPVTIIMTTAGHDRLSICYEVHEYAEKINTGQLQDDTFLGVIFGLKEGEDWTDPENWKKANPNLGVSVPLSFFEAEFTKAKSTPSRENAFKQLYLNQWTEQHTKWISDSQWMECGEDFDFYERFKGEEVYLGLDLSKTTDLTALSINHFDGEKFYTTCEFFLPGDDLREREKRDRAPYHAWSKDYKLHLLDGSVIDYGFVHKRILELMEHFYVVNIAFDPWNATALATNLVADGAPMVEVHPTLAKISPPTKELESLIISKKLVHDNNPILRWNIGNITIKRDANDNYRIDKAESRNKVDGAAATVLAMALMIRDINLGEEINLDIQVI